MNQQEKPAGLSTQVTERIYYRFLFEAEAKGKTISELLREIIEAFLDDKEVDREIGEETANKEKRKGPASEKQMKYIEILKKKTGKDIPEGKLTNEQADKLIKEMKAQLQKESQRQEEFDLKEEKGE